MQKISSVLLCMLLSYSTTSHAVNLENYWDGLQDFYKSFRSSSSYYLYENEALLNEALLARTNTPKAIRISNGPAWKLLTYVRLGDYLTVSITDPYKNTRDSSCEKVKPLESYYPETIGKIGYITGRSDWYCERGKFKSNAQYEANLTKIFEAAKAQSYEPTLKRLARDFSPYPISLKAQAVLDDIAQAKKDAAAAEAKRIEAIQTTLRARLNDSSNSIKKSTALANDWQKNTNFDGVETQSVITADEYQSLLSDIYSAINNENNLAGYEWFLSNYPASTHSLQALKNMEALAFDEAMRLHTIESYNDFVIAFPRSEFVKEAQARAYKLESKKYTDWLTSDAKLSRALLIQSKRLTRDMSLLNNSHVKTGYFLVVNRMNGLLQDQFPAEEATLRHLESQEFQSFFKSLTKTLKSIEAEVKTLNENSKRTIALYKQQVGVLKEHFTESLQEQKMANYYNREHQKWERYLKNM